MRRRAAAARRGPDPGDLGARSAAERDGAWPGSESTGSEALAGFAGRGVGGCLVAYCRHHYDDPVFDLDIDDIDEPPGIRRKRVDG